MSEWACGVGRVEGVKGGSGGGSAASESKVDVIFQANRVFVEPKIKESE